MKLKKVFCSTVLTGSLLFNAAYAAPAVDSDRETVYQVALLQSLALGYFEGSVTVDELKNFGDTGIGTFEGLDGEMIVLDGVVYRADEKLRTEIVSDKTPVPFSNVTFFDKDFSLKLKNVPNKNELEQKLNEIVKANGANSFYMIKLHGEFNDIYIRSERGQKKPYPTLVQALEADQKELTPKNVKGTIVGLYCPQYMGELNSVGWHFHFITDDKKTGGHVLDLNLKSGEAQLDKTDTFKMNLPNEKKFNSLNFKTDLHEDIRKAENG